MNKRGGREKGGTGTFLFFHSWPTGCLRPLPLHDPGWQRCTYPPFRVADSVSRVVSWVCAALPARGDHGARTPRAAFFGVKYILTVARRHKVRHVKAIDERVRNAVMLYFVASDHVLVSASII